MAKAELSIWCGTWNLNLESCLISKMIRVPIHFELFNFLFVVCLFLWTPLIEPNPNKPLKVLWAVRARKNLIWWNGNYFIFIAAWNVRNRCGRGLIKLSRKWWIQVGIIHSQENLHYLLLLPRSYSWHNLYNCFETKTNVLRIQSDSTLCAN